MMENEELIEGQDFTEMQEIVAEKSLIELQGEVTIQYLHAILYAITGKNLTDAMKTVYTVYLILSTQMNPVSLPLDRLAGICEHHRTTFIRARKRLIDEGLLYKLTKMSTQEPDRIGVTDARKFLVAKSDYGVVAKSDYRDFLRKNEGVAKSDHNPVRGNMGTRDSSVLNTTEFLDLGKQEQLTQELLSREGDSNPLGSASSFSSSGSLEQNHERMAHGADTDERDTHDARLREELAHAFDEPEAETESSSLKVPKGQAGSESNFRLRPDPPPRAKMSSKKIAPIPRRVRTFQNLAPELIYLMARICYRVTNTQQYMTLRKADIARCSSVVSQLTDAGADLTRLGEFEKWWWSWSGRKSSPSPEQVASQWWKAMDELTPKAVTRSVGTVRPPAPVTQQTVDADGWTEEELRAKEYLQGKAAEEAFEFLKTKKLREIREREGRG